MMSTYRYAVIASSNPGKIREFQEMLDALKIEALSYQSYYGHRHEVEEDGLTFEANASKKIAHCLPEPGVIVVGDDSGLVVPSLNGDPGVFSARYAGPNASSHDLCQKLLTNMTNISDRKAHFVCHLAALLPSGDICHTEGYLHGHIGTEMRGKNGFGFDPVFFPTDSQKTLAEIPSQEKNKISHRHEALTQLKKILESTKTGNFSTDVD